MTFSRLARYLLLMVCLGGAANLPVMALQAAPAADATKAASAPSETTKDEEGSGNDAFRHSAAVKMVGGWFHLDTETAARSFEYFNFAVLAGAVLFGLMKILPHTFRENRANIQHQLIEARTATTQANERLVEIEKKLAQLGEEIAAIGKQADKDSIEDEARIKAAIEIERVRITDAATRDIAAAGSAAQRDLKRYAAALAVDRATQKIALSDAEDSILVKEFVQDFARTFSHDRGKN